MVLHLEEIIQNEATAFKPTLMDTELWFLTIKNAHFWEGNKQETLQDGAASKEAFKHEKLTPKNN